jgi:cell division protein FtsI/penicillin-binding protein 2
VSGPRRFSVVHLLGLLIIMVGAGGSALIAWGPESFTERFVEAETTTTSTTEPPVVGGSVEDAEEKVATFVAALESGELSPVTFADATPIELAQSFDSVTSAMEPFSLAVSEGTVTVNDDGTASAPVEVVWAFADDDVTWTTNSTIELVPDAGTWLLRWSPSILEPSLGLGDRLLRERIAPSRAEILGRDGSVLVGQSDLVHIGIRPSRVQDLPALVAELQALLGIDPDDLTARVEAADPQDFVEVDTLPRPDYEAIREQIFPLPGTVFRESTVPEAPDPTLARALLGRSGEVTADIIERFPELFKQGDIAGLSGLQATYNPVLAGRAGIEISVLRGVPDPSSTTTGTGLTTTSAVRNPFDPELLVTINPDPGQPVITTIDPFMQKAAEDALEQTTLTSAMVVIEVSTGEIVALANGPRGATVNFAMTGQYPPGSIFKIVTAYGALARGLGPNDQIGCPASLTIGGRDFANAGGEAFGPIPFHFAFAHSCNTAFINAAFAANFDTGTLTETAAQFGIGTETDLGEFAFLGDVPAASDNVDLASASFGQGRVLVSPLAAAVMAATAADGIYRSPRLITSPTPGPQSTVELEPGPAAVLRDFMREVVTSGTGRAVSGVSGGPVSGKTGTAEFGNRIPPQSHAWFVGFQGNLAFAVFVEAGEFGGSTAAPIAAQFLNTVASQG